jgi:sulfotransferase family protein
MKKIFVVGCARSGTTLVQMLLGTRDDVYTCKETHFFQKIRRAGKSKVLDYFLLSRNSVLEAYEFIRTHNRLFREYDPSQVRTPRSAVMFFDQLMTSEAQARNKLVWVEKTPAHLFYISLIKRYVPSAQFVHVIRDGRDVIASLVDAARRFPQEKAWKAYADLDVAINEYNRCLRESSKYCGTAGHFFVPYEQLVVDTEQLTASLYKQLGLNIKNINLDLNEVHKQVVRNDENWKDDHGGEISDTRLEKFHRIFNDEQKQLIVSRIGNTPIIG